MLNIELPVIECEIGDELIEFRTFLQALDYAERSTKPFELSLTHYGLLVARMAESQIPDALFLELLCSQDNSTDPNQDPNAVSVRALRILSQIVSALDRRDYSQLSQN